MRLLGEYVVGVEPVPDSPNAFRSTKMDPYNRKDRITCRPIRGLYAIVMRQKVSGQLGDPSWLP